MEIEPQTVLVYVRPDGSVPYDDWFGGLNDLDARAAVRSRLDRLELGNFGDSKPVGQGVLELRVDVGPGYRVYLGRHGRAVVILLCGGDKSSQTKDIRRAKEFWSDYRSRARGKNS